MIPDYQTLMLPVLRAAADGEARVADVAERIADDLALTPEQRDELLPSGRQRVLHNRIHWAKFYMSKAGLISSPVRGRFIATDKGKALLAAAPERIDVALLMREPEFREFYRNEGSAIEEEGVTTKPVAVTPPNTTPEEQIDDAHAALAAALRDELLERILSNSPTFFEQLIVDLLVSMGYGGSHKNAAAQLGRTGDGGVDGIVNEDRLGLDRIYVQAKRYAPSNPVGRPDVNGFVGSLVGLGATKGVFVTTSTFSQPARDYVKHLAQRVILIDGQELTDLMIEHDVGVRGYRTVEFKRLDEDFFSEE
ncbi:restriction endonuclease [Hyphomicrobiales bacterium]|uniref:restriction endonuclease n=1 Tax=Ensifer sp. R-19 TaxID=3404055 RepID=UPI000DE3543B